MLFEDRPPGLIVEVEEHPRAHKEPAYKPGRRWCGIGGADAMVQRVRPQCPVMRLSGLMSSPASWWRSAKRLPWRQPMTILRRDGAHWSRRCGASQRPVRVVREATVIYFLDLACELRRG